MRTVAALLAALGMLIAASVVPGLPTAAAPIAQGQPTPPDGTPIVDPVPELRPIFLPLAVQRYDPRLPGPVGDAIEGYVAALTRAGRDACSPATHVLLTRPEGTRGAETVAVAFAGRPGPDLNLDFYLGEYVRVTGATDVAPEACVIAWRSVRVATLTVVDTPPR
jgi:hypothetical protein